MTAGAFAGPAGAWAAAGVGLCVTLLGSGAVIAWLVASEVAERYPVRATA